MDLQRLLRLVQAIPSKKAEPFKRWLAHVGAERIQQSLQVYCFHTLRAEGMAVQRDIFIFQCLIGCRVGDLYKLTKANVINGGVEYIPRKTKRYKDLPFDELLPLISQQKYNVAIKKMFLAAGLIRPVVVYNSTTSEQEIRPLNEVAEANAKEIDEDMKRDLVSMLV